MRKQVVIGIVSEKARGRGWIADMQRHAVCAVFVVLGFLARATCTAAVIGINFQGSGSDSKQTLAAGDAAGAVPAGNWNNVLYNASTNNLKDDTGTATTASLTPNGQLGAYIVGSETINTVNDKLLNGGIYTANNNATDLITITIGQLPPAFTTNGYDLYVYTFSDGYYGSTRGKDLVQADVGNDGSYDAQDTVQYNYISGQSNFNGTLTLATGGSIGQYVKFAGLGVGANTLRIKVSVNSGTRAVVNGIQLVAPSADTNVSITATATNASGRGPLPGVFRLARTGGVADGLTVNYAVGGTASNGVDYGLLTGQATIPAGTNALAITVAPVVNSIIKPPRTVALTLLSGTGYQAVSPSNATVTIAANDIRNAIGINLTSTTNNAAYVVDEGEYAGVLPLTHWNNLLFSSSDVALSNLTLSSLKGTSLVTSAGAFLHVVYPGMGTYTASQTPGSDPNEQLLGSGALAATGASANTTQFEFSVTNLPVAITAAGYDIYVYGFLDGYFGSYQGAQKIELDLGCDGSIDAFDTQKYNYTNAQWNYNGVLTRATAGSFGEYVAFTNVGRGVNSFKLRFSNAGNTQRAILSGVQVVAIVPPSGGTLFTFR